MAVGHSYITGYVFSDGDITGHVLSEALVCAQNVGNRKWRNYDPCVERRGGWLETSEMNGLTRFQKIVLAGLGACGGAATLYYGFRRDRKCAYASWTTNYSPTCEWDSNWDR